MDNPAPVTGAAASKIIRIQELIHLLPTNLSESAYLATLPLILTVPESDVSKLACKK